tara:strand:+ start:892 stop:1320 length:429 start_codon:yes stop_codon:yes gene_type:complete
MKNFILTLALMILVSVGANAQNVKGDWYVGTGDVADVSWTDLSISPTLGYGVTDELMIGFGVGQAESEDIDLDIHARYFVNVGEESFFVYAAIGDFDFAEDCQVGIGKMFTFHNDAVFIDPKLIYNVGDKTTNLTLGGGLRF